MLQPFWLVSPQILYVCREMKRYLSEYVFFFLWGYLEFAKLFLHLVGVFNVCYAILAFGVVVELCLFKDFLCPTLVVHDE